MGVFKSELTEIFAADQKVVEYFLDDLRGSESFNERIGIIDDAIFDFKRKILREAGIPEGRIEIVADQVTVLRNKDDLEGYEKMIDKAKKRIAEERKKKIYGELVEHHEKWLGLMLDHLQLTRKQYAESRRMGIGVPAEITDEERSYAEVLVKLDGIFDRRLTEITELAQLDQIFVEFENWYVNDLQKVFLGRELSKEDLKNVVAEISLKLSRELDRENAEIQERIGGEDKERRERRLH